MAVLGEPGAATASRPDDAGADRADHLLDGRADVGLLYVPFDPLDGLAHERLHTEDRVAVIPAGHRLARRASLRLADLDGEARPVWKGVSEVGPGLDPRIDHSVKAGARHKAGKGSALTEPVSEVSDIFQLLHLIAAGQVVDVLPRSLVPSLPPGVVLIPVSDAPPSHLVLAWNEHDRRPLVASFVAAVTAGVARGGSVARHDGGVGSPGAHKSVDRPSPRGT